MNLRTAMPLLAVVTALVAGCSGSSDKPKTLPSLTATPTPTSSPAAIPAAAQAKTREGADAFVRFFFQRLNVAFSNSDASIIKELQTGECTTCDNYQASLKSAAAKGRFLRGDTFVLTDLAVAPLQKLGTTVEVFGKGTDREEVDSAGNILATLRANGAFHFTVYVKTARSGWLVSAIIRETS